MIFGFMAAALGMSGIGAAAAASLSNADGACGPSPCASVPPGLGPCGFTPCTTPAGAQGPCGPNPCTTAGGQGPCGLKSCAPPSKLNPHQATPGAATPGAPAPGAPPATTAPPGAGTATSDPTTAPSPHSATPTSILSASGTTVPNASGPHPKVTGVVAVATSSHGTGIWLLSGIGAVLLAASLFLVRTRGYGNDEDGELPDA
ncbi:MAG: hypothetical protein M3083_14455 [Actinomycetota bacterium]|nr:hypothetical protein [Actinomycetota bacterium]